MIYIINIHKCVAVVLVCSFFNMGQLYCCAPFQFRALFRKYGALLRKTGLFFRRRALYFNLLHARHIKSCKSVYIYVYIYIEIYIYTHTFICYHCTSVPFCQPILRDTLTHMYTYIFIYIHIYMYMYMYMYVYIIL